MEEKKGANLYLVLQDKNDMYSSYMSFVKNGGVFVPTEKNFHLGEMVKVNLLIQESKEEYQFEGVIIWITPRGAQGNLPAGVGVQLSGAAAPEIKRKLENYLAGVLNSDKRTNTM